MTTEPVHPAADAGYLTDVLRRRGVLDSGRVRDVAIESTRTTVLSRILRLRITYDHASVAAPASLILKTVHPERAESFWFAGRQEVEFYSRIAAAMDSHLVPRCLEALSDPDTKAWHLLLEDLTDSHVIATVWPVPPSTAQCESIVGTLAGFHAAWWDDPRLGLSVGKWTSPDVASQQLQTFAGQLGEFIGHLGDRLPPQRRDLYQRFLDASPRLLARYHAHRNATVLHGDAHVWNCFLPKDSSRDGVLLFDWDNWHLGVGSRDLAYMMAMHWYPDGRRHLERPLLDLYHTTLLEHGVSGYDRRALQEDYRWATLRLITLPVYQWLNDIPAVIWWNNLERILLAIDDLGCRELLD